MNTYQHSSFKFAGLTLDGFLTSDDKTWITITSFTEEVGSRRNAQDWIAKQNISEVLQVFVGQKNKQANAYRVSIIREYLKYRCKLGDEKAWALFEAVLEADLDRSIREALGQEVTSQQHEAKRAEVRQALIDFLMSKYEARPGNFVTKDQCDAVGLSDLEAKIAYERAYIKQKMQVLKRNNLTREEKARFRAIIQQTKQKIQQMITDANAVVV